MNKQDSASAFMYTAASLLFIYFIYIAKIYTKSIHLRLNLHPLIYRFYILFSVCIHNNTHTHRSVSAAECRIASSGIAGVGADPIVAISLGTSC